MYKLSISERLWKRTSRLQYSAIERMKYANSLNWFSCLWIYVKTYCQYIFYKPYSIRTYNRNSILFFHHENLFAIFLTLKWLTNKIGRNVVYTNCVIEEKKIDCDVHLAFKVNYICVVRINWILTKYILRI